MAPGLIVPLLVALLLMPGATPAAAEMPEGCREDAGGYVCEFHTSTQAGAQSIPTDPEASGQVRFPIVAFERNIVTIAVAVSGVNQGWYLSVFEGTAPDERRVLLRQAPPAETLTQREHRDTSTHYLEVDPTRDLTLVFWAYGGIEKFTVADFVISYAAFPAAQGAAPELPAATADDPHVRDEEGDVARAWLDGVAFWFGDAGLGDGLMDAHLLVADLDSIPATPEPDVSSYFWDLEFSLQGARYVIKWVQDRGCSDGTTACYAQSAVGDEVAWRCQVLQIASGRDGIAVTEPTCGIDLENDTLHATFPESALGNPGPGVGFHEMRMLTGAVLAPFGGRSEANDGSGPTGDGAQHEDESRGERFAFALGGPDVWCEYREASCVEPAAWYTEPLAAENVPNTLQVLGAFFAIGAFLLGLVVVRARRRRIRKLLAEVEEVVRAHREDAARGLLVLGDLEESFDARLKQGKITEADYQIVSQRIATSATRLAMRREQGLDDGVPDAHPRTRS